MTRSASSRSRCTPTMALSSEWCASGASTIDTPATPSIWPIRQVEGRGEGTTADASPVGSMPLSNTNCAAAAEAAIDAAWTSGRAAGFEPRKAQSGAIAVPNRAAAPPATASATRVGKGRSRHFREPRSFSVSLTLRDVEAARGVSEDGSLGSVTTARSPSSNGCAASIGVLGSGPGTRCDALAGTPRGRKPTPLRGRRVRRFAFPCAHPRRKLRARSAGRIREAANVGSASRRGIRAQQMDEHTKQWLLLGREHYQKREFDKAEPALRQVLETTERLADVHDMLGVICHSRGNFAQAEHHFERALAINPTYTEAALNLAVTYNDRGKYEAARQVYSRIRGAASDDSHDLDPFVRGKIANMHAEVAQAYADAGLVREAIEQYEKAVQLCPQFADLRTKLGTLLREVSDLTRAREQYEEAIRARPSYVPARVLLGVTLLSLGQAEAAAEEWRKALEVEPDNVPARMYLRISTAERGLDASPPGPAGPPRE